MSDIIINIEDNAFVLMGGIETIQNNGRAKSNFKSIGASFDNSGKIILAFDELNKDEVYKNIKRLLEKFHLAFEKTPEAESVLENIIQREKNFADFSKKAADIRNDKHESDDFKKFVDIVEKSLKRKLYPLQLLSAYHLAFAQNACNFSVPGAGKTSIVYAAYAYLKNLPVDDGKHVDRILIICPLAAFGPWEDEYEECFDKKPIIKKLVGVSARYRADYFISPEQIEITLISYQSASSDVDYIKGYLERHNVMVVLDEAHNIKNTSDDAVWANAVLSIADNAKARVVLTGTPAPNGYQDLQNLYKFIWPHNNIIGFPLHYLADLVDKPDDKKKELIDNIKPFFIRIKKKDLGLPEAKFHPPIMVEMAPNQKIIYEHIEGNYIDSFESNSNNSNFSEKLSKAKGIRLRQCLTNPALLKKPLREYKEEYQESGVSGVDDRTILQAIDNYQSTPNKFVKAGDLVEEISKKNGADGKSIIWAYFVDNIESLATYLQDRNIPCEVLYGATPNENEDTEDNVLTREKIIRDFHDDACPYKVIIANPFAVGVSISLHKACHNAIYLEKDFNATNYMQSKDRTHRYGLKQDDIVNYYYLLSENSIDQTIHERVLEKEKLMLEIIDDEIPLLQMNMTDSDDVDGDDIRAIMSDYYARKPS